jgi:hypothetical protein
MGFRDDPAVFDEQTPPGDHPPVVKVIVPHHFELGFVTAVRLWVKDLLGLNVRMQFFLLIFQAHRQVSGPSRFPEKIEVIPHTFALIELGYRAEKAVLPFETD